MKTLGWTEEELQEMRATQQRAKEILALVPAEKRHEFYLKQAAGGPSASTQAKEWLAQNKSK